MSKRAGRSRPEPPAPVAPFNQGFSSLRDRLPEGWTAPTAEPAATAAKGPARAVVRLERKGRGGKEATLVEKLGLEPAELARWADDLKRSLGCGGGVEGEAMALQGDQRERVVVWLTERGVRKVVRG